jgi:hypothetical protein
VEQWPGSKLEFTFFMAVNIGTYQIGRQQVRGELNTVKISFDGFGEGFYRCRLRQTGHTLDQEMTLTQEADEHAVDEITLSDNPRGKMGTNIVQNRGVDVAANSLAAGVQQCAFLLDDLESDY